MDLTSWDEEPPQRAPVTYEKEPDGPRKPRKVLKPKGSDHPKRVRISQADAQGPSQHYQSHQEQLQQHANQQAFAHHQQQQQLLLQQQQQQQQQQQAYQPVNQQPYHHPQPANYQQSPYDDSSRIVPHAQARAQQARAQAAHRGMEHAAHNPSPNRQRRAPQEPAPIGLVPQNKEPSPGKQKKLPYKPGKYHCLSKQSEYDDLLFARRPVEKQPVALSNNKVAKEILSPSARRPGQAPSHARPNKQSPSKLAAHPAFNERVTRLVQQQDSKVKPRYPPPGVRRSQQKGPDVPKRQLFRGPSHASQDPDPSLPPPTHGNPPPVQRFHPPPDALPRPPLQPGHAPPVVQDQLLYPPPQQYPPAAYVLGEAAGGLEKYLSPPHHQAPTQARWAPAQARQLGQQLGSGEYSPAKPGPALNPGPHFAPSQAGGWRQPGSGSRLPAARYPESEMGAAQGQWSHVPPPRAAHVPSSLQQPQYAGPSQPPPSYGHSREPPPQHSHPHHHAASPAQPLRAPAGLQQYSPGHPPPAASPSPYYRPAPNFPQQTHQQYEVVDLMGREPRGAQSRAQVGVTPVGWGGAKEVVPREVKMARLAHKMEMGTTDFISAGLGREGGGAPLHAGNAYGGRQGRESRLSDWEQDPNNESQVGFGGGVGVLNEKKESDDEKRVRLERERADLRESWEAQIREKDLRRREEERRKRRLEAKEEREMARQGEVPINAVTKDGIWLKQVSEAPQRTSSEIPDELKSKDSVLVSRHIDPNLPISPAVTLMKPLPTIPASIQGSKAGTPEQELPTNPMSPPEEEMEDQLPEEPDEPAALPDGDMEEYLEEDFEEEAEEEEEPAEEIAEDDAAPPPDLHAHGADTEPQAHLQPQDPAPQHRHPHPQHPSQLQQYYPAPQYMQPQYQPPGPPPQGYEYQPPQAPPQFHQPYPSHNPYQDAMAKYGGGDPAGLGADLGADGDWGVYYYPAMAAMAAAPPAQPPHPAQRVSRAEPQGQVAAGRGAGRRQGEVRAESKWDRLAKPRVRMEDGGAGRGGHAGQPAGKMVGNGRRAGAVREGARGGAPAVGQGEARSRRDMQWRGGLDGIPATHQPQIIAASSRLIYYSGPS